MQATDQATQTSKQRDAISGGSHMKAVWHDHYGPIESLSVRDLEKPAIDEEQVLVRVHAASVAGDDWHLLQGLPYLARLESGIRKPKRSTPGYDFAGVIEAVGSKVEGFSVGQRVMGYGSGTYAEYAAIDASSVVAMPDALDFNQAAAMIMSGFTALQTVKVQGKAASGERVLINGASGCAGHLAVQVAKAQGAHVTGVCSTANLELVRSIGADEVIDYTQADFSESGQQWDLIVDFASNLPLSKIRKAMTKRGRLMLIGSAAIRDLRGRNRWFKGVDRWLKAMVYQLFISQKMTPAVTTRSPENLATLKELADAGKLRANIDRTFPLEAFTEALAYTRDRRAAGAVVVTM